MTTTSKFQKTPDYYSSIEECMLSKKQKINTNPRYKDFTQTHFTAGDENQFQEYRDSTNGQICIPEIQMKDNIFKSIDFSKQIQWAKYQNLNSTAVDNTFRYMFNKLKKGIFVKIKNNQLKVFLPFSKKNFINEWGNRIKIDPKYGDIYGFIRHISEMEGRRFYKNGVNRFPDTWYANNCLVRYEYPVGEGDTNIPNMCDMLKTLCENREIPDIEFFVNRRDFPVIKRNSTEPYDDMFGHNHPLISHQYDQYSPILSMVTTDEHADITIPTGEDWSRIRSKDGKYFAKECREYNDEFKQIPWVDKKPTAVFRGTSTGCGNTVDTNMRLKVALLSVTTPPDNIGPFLDAGISKWNLRPRKLAKEKYLTTIDLNQMEKLGIKKVNRLTPEEQTGYKYLINIDGHVSAFRLSLELSMGCCLLLVDSKYKMWFRNMLKPYVHYVPVDSNLSNLISQIEWCRKNDEKCEQISKNAKEFYTTYLQQKGVLDYLQKLIINLKNETGVYLYNSESPLNIQIEGEKQSISKSYPKTQKTVENIISIPKKQGRSYGILKGIEWILNMINDKSSFDKIAIPKDIIKESVKGLLKVKRYTIADFYVVSKKSQGSSKQLENIHETYIGIKCINDIVRYVPNFAYVFGMYDGLFDDKENSKHNVVMEYIEGPTFNEWIHSPEFNMKDYIFILLQLSLAIQTAQSKCGFVHYDLTPWNIIIQKLPSDVSFDYLIGVDKIYQINTKLIPVIIDYGKSHVIYNNRHHGFVNMYKMSTIQDILSILITSIYEITSFESLSKNDVNDVIKLSNFLTGSKYHPNKFIQSGYKGLGDVRYFFNNAKKYNEMVYSDKYELEKLTPLDFIEYVNQKFPYKFSYTILKHPQTPNFRINKGNPRQVFDYILSENNDEKINSFVQVFKRLDNCQFPDTTNIILAYYTLQTIIDNISSVYDIMIKYVKSINGNIKICETLYNESILKLTNKYNALITRKNEPYTYLLPNSQILEQCPYTEHTFLLPDVIYNLIQKYKKQDLHYISDYKDIVLSVLTSNSKFKITEEHYIYYMKNFKDLLLSNNTAINNNITNAITLYSVSHQLYNENIKILKTKLSYSDKNCSAAKEYLKIYEKIVSDNWMR